MLGSLTEKLFLEWWFAVSFLIVFVRFTHPMLTGGVARLGFGVFGGDVWDAPQTIMKSALETGPSLTYFKT